MSLAEERFAVRGYELDADGLVPPHVWLRYMENLRWLSGSRGPAELVERFRAGDTFVVVAQALCVLRDVGLGNDLTGSMWIGRVGRTSVDFWHAFRAAGELVAAGRVTAVYVVKGRPAPLPDALRTVELENTLAAVAFPEPLRHSAPAEAFRHRLQVRPGDLDLLRHVNHSSYSVFADAARHAAARAGAYGAESERAAGRVRGVSLEYLAQALLGESLTEATWVVSSEPLTLGFELTRDRTVLGRARLGL